MTTYYHITNYKNLESICTHGLIPQCGIRTKSILDNRCAIFLSKGIINSILMYGNLLFHFNSYVGEKGLGAIEF